MAIKFVAIRRQIEKILAALSAVIFPTVLVAIAGGVLLWRLVQVETIPAQDLPIRVWMEESAESAPSHQAVLGLLQTSIPTVTFETKLSTRDFWFVVDPGSQFNSGAQLVDFPSRHTTTLSCWDATTDALLGVANRSKTEGQLSFSRGGFALAASLQQPLGQILCKAAFRVRLNCQHVCGQRTHYTVPKVRTELQVP